MTNAANYIPYNQASHGNVDDYGGWVEWCGSFYQFNAGTVKVWTQDQMIGALSRGACVTIRPASLEEAQKLSRAGFSA